MSTSETSGETTVIHEANKRAVAALATSHGLDINEALNAVLAIGIVRVNIAALENFTRKGGSPSFAEILDEEMATLRTIQDSILQKMGIAGVILPDSR